MGMTDIHAEVLGFGLIGLWAIICIWALVLRLTRATETPVFWRAVSVAQVLLAIQLVAGLVLLAMGKRPGPDGDAGTLAFHFAYGILFPLITLGVAHKVARDGKYNAHSVFAVVGLVLFGLTARAWMVGRLGA